MCSPEPATEALSGSVGERIRARTRKGKDGKKEQTGLFGHFEYVSRIIVWDLVTDTLSVHKPTIFAPFSDDANARLAAQPAGAESGLENALLVRVRVRVRL